MFSLNRIQTSTFFSVLIYNIFSCVCVCVYVYGNLLQYSCQENPMDRGVWWASVHEVTKSQTWLRRLGVYMCVCVCVYI